MNEPFITKSTRLYKLRLIPFMIFIFLLLEAIILLAYVLIYPYHDMTIADIDARMEWQTEETECYFEVTKVMPLVYKDGREGYSIFFSGGGITFSIDAETLLCSEGTRYMGTVHLLEGVYEGSKYTKSVAEFYYATPDLNTEFELFRGSLYETILQQELDKSAIRYRHNMAVFSAVQFFIMVLFIYIVYRRKLIKYSRLVSMKKERNMNNVDVS